MPVNRGCIEPSCVRWCWTRVAAILFDRGLQTQASSLTFKAALERVAADTGLRFSNASVIGRIWDDQRQFRLDVLKSFASIDFRSEIDAVVAAIAPGTGRKRSVNGGVPGRCTT